MSTTKDPVSTRKRVVFPISLNLGFPEENALWTMLQGIRPGKRSLVIKEALMKVLLGDEAREIMTDAVKRQCSPIASDTALSPAPAAPNAAVVAQPTPQPHGPLSDDAAADNVMDSGALMSLVT